MTSIVGARHLSKSFGAIAALKDVSLDIAPGEIRAICGENGAGKSTLVKLLTGVYRPDSGSVTVSGEARAIATPRQAQELGIAFVAQELSLCPDLSVEDNIWLGSVKVPLLHKREEFSRRARATPSNCSGAGTSRSMFRRGGSRWVSGSSLRSRACSRATRAC